MNAAAPIAPPELLDALLELMNIGIGRAAATISELSQREVGITVPRLEIFDFENPGLMDCLQHGVALRISQSFTGGITGHCLLALNQDGARSLSTLLLGKEADHDAFDGNDQSALLELGNIVMNGVIGNLANQINDEVNYEIPQLQLRGIAGFADLISDLAAPGTSRALVMQASLSIAADRINGHLILLFTDRQMAELITKLERSIGRT